MLKKLRKKAGLWFSNRKIINQVAKAVANLQQPRSIIFYTTHKCASTFAQRLFEVLAKETEYELVDYAGAIWSAGDRFPNIETPYELFLERAYTELYSLNGKIYAPQREYLDFPGRHQFKHIFFLRDPRDVLVSAYYSFAFTHAEPLRSQDRDVFIEQRAKMQAQEIDIYVLEQAEQWLLPIYQKYQQLRESADSYLYVKYDLFINDTMEFVRQVADFCEFTPSPKEIRLLTKEASPVQSEEKMTHKRSGKTGQYLQKLRPETIEKLNIILADTLRDWNFPS